MKSKAIVLLLLGGVVGCSSEMPDDPVTTGDDAAAAGAQVTGTLMYRERMPLPKRAHAEAQSRKEGSVPEILRDLCASA